MTKKLTLTQHKNQLKHFEISILLYEATTPTGIRTGRIKFNAMEDLLLPVSTNSSYTKSNAGWWEALNLRGGQALCYM